MTAQVIGSLARPQRYRSTLASLLLATTGLVAIPEVRAEGTLTDIFGASVNAIEVVGLSDDGSKAAVNGTSGRFRQEAYYWNGQEGTSLGGLDRNVNTIALAMSGDGNVIVGISLDPYVRTRAFRWTSDGIVDLGSLRSDNGGNSWAMDTSSDGSVVVGETDSWLNQRIGFAWIAGATTGQSADGQMFALRPSSGAIGSGARGVSADGRYAVGYGEYETAGMTRRTPVLWHLSEIEDGQPPLQGHLATLAVERSSEANDISDDGSVIVGWSANDVGAARAVRWAGEDREIEDLGTLDGTIDSYALVVSGDGEVIGGYAADIDGRHHAFRWEDQSGMVYVGDWLAENGVDIGSSRLAEVKALSDDGSIVAGSMMDENGNERAYIARVVNDEPNGGGNGGGGNGGGGNGGEGNGGNGGGGSNGGGGGNGGGSGIMDVAEYQRSLLSTAQIASAGEFLTWLPMNGAHHRPLMQTPSLSGDVCAWATGDFAHHGDSSTNLALAEAGACVDLAGGAVRLGGAVGTSRSWQALSLGGAVNMAGQYVLGEVDWQPDGTPLLLSVTGMIGGWQANVDRAYSNGAATAVSSGQTNALGGVVRVRADWLEAAVIGNTSINPWASLAFGGLRVDGFSETGGPFPASFAAQNLGHADIRLGVTAVTEFSSQTKLSTTLELAHRTGTAGSAVGQVDGLFSFSLGGGNYAQTWGRLGLELDHAINDAVSLSGSVHLATNGRDPTVAISAGIKGAF